MPTAIVKTDLTDIRRTDDGRYSVYDYLRLCTDYKNPRDIYKRLCDNYDDVVGICDDVIFTRSDGRKGTKVTPVTDERGLLHIHGLLPGVAGSRYRQTAADLVYRHLQHDVTLAEEIVAQTTDDTTRVAVIATNKLENDTARQIVAETAIDNIEDAEKAKQVADFAQTQVEYLGSYHTLHRELDERGAVNTWGNRLIPYRRRRNTHAEINKINTESIGQVTCGTRKHYTLEQKTQLTLIQQIEHKRIVRQDIVGHDELVESCDYVANTLSNVIAQLVG